MEPIVIGALTFGVSVLGVLTGVVVRTQVPADRFDDAATDTVRLGVRFIAMMTALILGLMTASAKGTHDAVNAAVGSSAMDVMALDRVLARYGPDATPIRVTLESAVRHRVEMLWPRESTQQAEVDPMAVAHAVETIARRIHGLSPEDEERRALHAQATRLAESLLESRWAVAAGMRPPVPMLFLCALLFWLTVTFVSFGLFAPRNALVLAMLLLCALSVGLAVMLVFELDSPFHGFVRASPGPLLYVLSHLGQ